MVESGLNYDTQRKKRIAGLLNTDNPSWRIFLYSKELTRRYEGLGIKSMAVHPGMADTRLGKSYSDL